MSAQMPCPAGPYPRRAGGLRALQMLRTLQMLRSSVGQQSVESMTRCKRGRHTRGKVGYFV